MNKLQIALIVIFVAALVISTHGSHPALATFTSQPPTCPPGTTGPDCLPWRPPLPAVEKESKSLTLIPVVLPVSGGLIVTKRLHRTGGTG